MKKKIAAFSVMILCMSMVVSGTLAYFTHDDIATNVITTGGINIELEEWRDEERLTPFINPVEVMPGTSVTKIVTVKNIEQPAYIRARFDVTIKDESGAVKNISAAELAHVVKIDVNDGTGGYWTKYLKEGESTEWYYYNVAVGTDKVTEPLFTHVEFDGPNMDNKYQNCTVEINVCAEAVQQANNPAEAGKTYLAAGWN